MTALVLQAAANGIPLIKGGKVTLAVSNFPMNNRSANAFIPVGQPLSVWLEEMKVPPLFEWVKYAFPANPKI